MHRARALTPLSVQDAEIYVASNCFKTGPPGKIGIEVERTVHRHDDVAAQVTASDVRGAVGSRGERLPGGGTITLEPGGQLEISSACAADLPGLISATRDDLARTSNLLKEAGLRFGELALDPFRPSRRTLELPRYKAMEEQFDRTGPAGRTMMCSTASLQVSLDAGIDGTGPGSATQRWHQLHALAPLLTAMFANSPFANGRPSGWRSSRQAAWLGIDPTRTAAPVPLLEDPRHDWARYALDANVLCIRPENNRENWYAPRSLTMRDWLRGAGPRPATQQDLDYHLTTLFPPVRPRGFLELRVIDAQAGGNWEVPTAVVAALVEDPSAAAVAAEACRNIPAGNGALRRAAHDGLTDPEFARAALVCAEAARDALPRLGADQETRRRVETFMERYTARSLSPADVSLAEWQRTGRIQAFVTDNPGDHRKERVHEHH